MVKMIARVEKTYFSYIRYIFSQRIFAKIIIEWVTYRLIIPLCKADYTNWRFDDEFIATIDIIFG